jgi:hypothetical protein
MRYKDEARYVARPRRSRGSHMYDEAEGDIDRAASTRAKDGETDGAWDRPAQEYIVIIAVVLICIPAR